MKALVDRRHLGDHGQMTIELCVILPVAIVVAAMVVNATAFFGYCAEFDRVARNAIRVVAASPDAGQGKGEAAARIKEKISSCINAPNLVCEVSATSNGKGLDTYEAELKYWPTLFGMGIRSSVFGVSLPPLVHKSCLTVDPYSPGKLL